jgi:hypothetical protein
MVVSYKTALGEPRFIGQLDNYCKPRLQNTWGDSEWVVEFGLRVVTWLCW